MNTTAAPAAVKDQMASLRKGQVVKITSKTTGAKVRQITRRGEVALVRDMGSIVLVQCWRMANTKQYGYVRTMRSFIVTSGRTVAVEVVE